MRIIAGQWRGRKLQAPKGDATRPTTDRVRESLFNMLASRLGSFDQLQVLDLFAGTGALGLEALSRGAAHCTFVEQDRHAIASLKANLDALGANGTIKAQSVLSLGPVATPVDLALIDPPYRSGAGAVALDRLARLGWFGPASCITLELARDEEMRLSGYQVEKRRDIGNSSLLILRKES